MGFSPPTYILASMPIINYKWYLSYMDNTLKFAELYWIFKQLLFDFKLDFLSEAFILTCLYLGHKSTAVPTSIFAQNTDLPQLQKKGKWTTHVT